MVEEVTEKVSHLSLLDVHRSGHKWDARKGVAICLGVCHFEGHQKRPGSRARRFGLEEVSRQITEVADALP